MTRSEHIMVGVLKKSQTTSGKDIGPRIKHLNATTPPIGLPKNINRTEFVQRSQTVATFRSGCGSKWRLERNAKGSKKFSVGN
jgi:hypothetical protein